MFPKRLLILSLMSAFISTTGVAGWNQANQAFQSNAGNKEKRILLELVDEGYYFSALPLMKEHLTTSSRDLDLAMERALSKIIATVGVKQFETLPSRYLARSSSQNMRYINAKKLMREQKYADAIRLLKGIRKNHPISPYAYNMLGSIYSIEKSYANASVAFRDCIGVSNARINVNRSDRLKLNRDYCLAGLARNKFGAADYNDSDLLYLDIPKSSPVWPEILFEEAWNSYYQKNYNRSLGKLVTYKAPVFEHVFNPEIEVLNALTYLRLCLYQDARNISDDFYAKYIDDAKKLRAYLRKYRTNYDFYYDLVSRYEQSRYAPSELMATLFKSISREQVYEDMKSQLKGAIYEYRRIKGQRDNRFKRYVIQNLQEAIGAQKTILGSFIRSKLTSHYAQLFRAFEGMSYIKLEVLAQKKAKLYSFEKDNRSRGDIKYIQRNEKQYFWDFNGEFWADELGDYVFALKSEC
ncbi:MAG: hypothetical protein CME65_07015 [Halobacteriovoraceae bacterium]|nr:hypothetical protein [Halobacteriovoraceae bacterium]|tara:strand:- start:10720 stop:12120 length:1401 start_codon:yes stop_codon:yes gene_type:complete